MSETKKKKFIVTVVRTGVVPVEAASAEEAMHLADGQPSDVVLWGDDWNPTHAEEADPADDSWPDEAYVR